MSSGRLYHTEGIVVRRRDQGEADRVLTLCTPAGKIDVIAKGARKIHSRKAGHIELFARASFVLSRLPNSWDIVSQVDMIEPNTRLRSELVRGAYARYAAELFDGFFAQEEGGPALYDLLHHTLSWLCQDDDCDLTARFYEQHLLGLAGFRPELYRCVGDHPHPQSVRLDELNQDGSPLGLDPERGGILCADCYAAAGPYQRVIALSPQVLSLLRQFQRGPYTRLLGMPIPPAMHTEAERVMHYYIAHHLERRVRSIAFLRQLGHRKAGLTDPARPGNTAEL